MKNEELTYAQAIAEIESIIEKIRTSELNIDELDKDIERATELIKFSKSKLFATEENINKILEKLEQEN